MRVLIYFGVGSEGKGLIKTYFEFEIFWNDFRSEGIILRIKSTINIESKIADDSYNKGSRLECHLDNISNRECEEGEKK